MKLKNTRKANEQAQNGIHKINYPACDKSYLGKTTKAIKTEFKEDLTAIDKIHDPSYNSNLATHIVNNKHEILDIKHTVEQRIKTYRNIY